MDKLENNPKWVDAMIFLIQHYCTKTKVFRWHDSGDLQSVQHLVRIVNIAECTPNVRHWLPTREVTIVKKYKDLFGEFPSNLVVRISATMVNGMPHSFHEHSSTVATSNALAIGHLCPAPKQDNKCGDCRACWDPNIKTVTYLDH